MSIPPLWHYRCAEASEGDFVTWDFANCGVVVSAYRNGAWPVVKCEEVRPSRLSQHCIRKGNNGIVIVVCPLCYDISVFEPGMLKPHRQYACPGHAGSAQCPGYVYGIPSAEDDLSSAAMCSIQ